MDTGTRITGIENLYTALSTKIPLGMEPKLLQQALSAGTNIFAKAVKANIHNRTGTLSRSVYSGRGKKSNSFQQVRIVNFHKGNRTAKAKGGSRDGWYGRLVEYGHRAAAPHNKLARKGIFSRRGSRAPFGLVPPHPIVAPAYFANATWAQDAVEAKLEQVINRAIEKARF